MNRESGIIASPLIAGLVLVVVSQVDLALFERGVIEVRTLLSWELAIVMAGLFASFVAYMYAAVCMFRNQPVIAVKSFLGATSFLVLMSIGGALGGAYLNAA